MSSRDPNEIDNFIRLLSKIPGLGPRSGRRAALELIKKREQLLLPLKDSLIEIYEKIVLCQVCNNIEEVILALSATIDGQTTMHFLSDLLSKYNIRITKLAHGIPIGGELDYLDDGTLTQAILSRTDAG